jgi:hypothetical protein
VASSGRVPLSARLVRVHYYHPYCDIDTAMDCMYFVLEGELEVRIDLAKQTLSDKDLKTLEQDLNLSKHE